MSCREINGRGFGAPSGISANAQIQAYLDAALVAQVCNLPYRRFAIGSAPIMPAFVELFTSSGLQIRDTADCKSALRRQCADRSANRNFLSFTRIRV
jgi:hypothetical protein